jgi:hypothetical protein
MEVIIPNLLDLQDILTEALVREIIEKTKSCAITWSSLGSAQFYATEIQAGETPVTWQFYLTKTQIGNLSYKYTLDVKKDGVAYVTPVSGPLIHSSRDSAVQDLYEIVEIIVLELDAKLKETIQFVQNISGCRQLGLGD